MEISTPACDKLKQVAPFSQKIGEFLDWLGTEKHITFARWVGDELHIAHFDVSKTLAEFFDIDMNQVEKERREILEHLRAKP